MKCNRRICNLNTPTFYISRMNFCGQIFSGVHHPQDVQDEKVSTALSHWDFFM